MREIAIGVAVLAALLLAVDALAWQAVRRALRLRPNARATRAAAGLYWGTAVLVPPLLVFALLAARRGADALGWGVISTIGVLYLPKAVLAVAVLADWLVSGAARLGARLAVADRAAQSRAVSVAGLGVAAAIYAWLLLGGVAGREALAVRRVDVPVAGLPAALDGLVIAHVSDLHLASLRGRPGLVRKVIAAVDDARPDLVVCTGDVAPAAGLDDGPEILDRLRAPLGTFAVAGNHDFGTRELAQADWADSGARERDVAALRQAYAARGARLLVNEAATVERGGARVTLVGTGVSDEHHGYRDADLDRAFAGLDSGGVAVLLTHNPELWDAQVVGRRPVPLTLAGHTHGGQIGLEIGPLRASLAGLELRRWAGLYREGSQFLYVNRGVGLYGPPFRVGIPPEVALLRLVRPAPPPDAGRQRRRP